MSLLVNKAKKHCLDILRKSRCRDLPFHNAKHTVEVYGNVVRIGAYEKIDIEALEPVQLAALFHDVGNVISFQGHENISIDKAKDFLQSEGYPRPKIDKVVDCIWATRMPQRPTDIYESIICDADLRHLGTKDFLEINQCLRKEWSEHLDMSYTDDAWNTLNIRFLQEHEFHTNYGKEILEPIKEQHIDFLKQRQKCFKSSITD